MPTTRLLIHCSEPEAIEVAFEPWGALHTLNRDDAFTVEISGPGDGLVEIGYSPGWIRVCAWLDDDGTVAEMTAQNERGEPLRM